MKYVHEFLQNQKSRKKSDKVKKNSHDQKANGPRDQVKSIKKENQGAKRNQNNADPKKKSIQVKKQISKEILSKGTHERRKATNKPHPETSNEAQNNLTDQEGKYKLIWIGCFLLVIVA